MKRIDHAEAYSMDGACTNAAEEYFSRLRRAEIGHHHHIAGDYLLRYAREASWREDNRHLSNGEQVNRFGGLALWCKPSVDFSGYWQRHEAFSFSHCRRRVPKYGSGSASRRGFSFQSANFQWTGCDPTAAPVVGKRPFDRTPQRKDGLPIGRHDTALLKSAHVISMA